jgi:hypothetical protein
MVLDIRHGNTPKTLWQTSNGFLWKYRQSAMTGKRDILGPPGKRTVFVYYDFSQLIELPWFRQDK